MQICLLHDLVIVLVTNYLIQFAYFFVKITTACDGVKKFECAVVSKQWSFGLFVGFKRLEQLLVRKQFHIVLNAVLLHKICVRNSCCELREMGSVGANLIWVREFQQSGRLWKACLVIVVINCSLLTCLLIDRVLNLLTLLFLSLLFFSFFVKSEL